MLKEEPVRTRQPIAGVVTPSKVNQAGRSAVRIQQQQQQQQRLQCSEQGALLDTSTPSKVAVGHDFR
jgi:RES domain-containing protein